MTNRLSTDALIAQLAATPAPASRYAPAHLIWVMAVTALLCLVAQLLTSGPRPGLGTALMEPMILAKIGLPLAVLVLAWPMAAHLARPGARIRSWPLIVPVAAAVALSLWALFVTPGDRIIAAWMGKSPQGCVASVLTLSILPLLAGMRVMRQGASTRPRLSGALIGLAAGAGASAGYALSCTEDSPLFFVFWYGAAILLTTAIGALAGQRFLRW